MEEVPIFSDWQSPTASLTLIVRLAVSSIAGGLIGLQREYHGKAAGLRTHILVALAAALLVTMASAAGMPPESTARVIQGIVTGIGFIGAGTILKLESEHRIRGLTTAASLWVTTAISITYALGFFWVPT